MSLANFAPTIWSARIQAHLDKALIVAGRANRSYEVDARHGTAKINKVGDIAVSTHSANGTVSYGIPASTQQTLTLNQRKIAAFKVDDLAAVQANVNLVEQYSRRLAYALSNNIDRYVAGLYTSAGAGDVTVDIAAVAASEIRNAFAQAATNLDKHNVPAEGRWAVISPIMRGAFFQDTAVTQPTETGDRILASGSIGQFMGFDLFMSNNLSGTGVTVTLSGNEAVGQTALSVNALTGAIPIGTRLTFDNGVEVVLTADADVSDTSITVAPLTVALESGDAATYVKVRKALYGTNDAITFAMNLTPNVEALRDVDTTDDYVRAEQNYGALVLEPYALGTITATEVS